MKKNIYFTSDNHLGAPDNTSSLVRERLFVKWLGEIKPKAKALFILGDLFDVWFEYKTVVPKGFVRVLGKLAELSDEGIEIHYFVGNHDMWMIDYLEKEIGAKVYFNPQVIELGDKLFFIGHGDGLGPKDKGYKRMKKTVSKSFFPMALSLDTSRYWNSFCTLSIAQKQNDIGARRPQLRWP